MQDAICKIKGGEFTCHLLSDGNLVYPAAAVLADAPANQLAGVLTAEELAAGQLTVPYNALLVDTGAHRVLIDTGAGPLGPATGGLINSLRGAGVAPETVDLVVFSHAHPDHIGGTVDGAGNLSFPNARFIMLRAEFDYWKDEAIQERLAANELYRSGFDPVIGQWIRTYLPPIENRLELLERDAEIAPGVQAIPAAGHTPGHLAVMVSSGRQQVLYAGDSVIHPAQIGRPEWNSMFETDRRAAEQTRRQLLDRAATDRCLVAGTHLATVGRVVRSGSGYKWEAESAAGA